MYIYLVLVRIHYTTIKGLLQIRVYVNISTNTFKEAFLYISSMQKPFPSVASFSKYLLKRIIRCRIEHVTLENC